MDHVGDQRPRFQDSSRQRRRDDVLWSRETSRARFLNLKHMQCPCSKCKGQRKLTIRTVKEHLIRNGRAPAFRIWRGPGERHSSDEEWEEDFWTGAENSHGQVLDSGVDTRQMLENAVEMVDEPPILQERAADVILEAFSVADAVHDRCLAAESVSGHSSFEEARKDEADDAVWTDDVQDIDFDVCALEDAMQELYAKSKCTTLAATILLLNLFTVHGVTNIFADELLVVLHGHLLPEGNFLPKNHYAARALTRKLGLTYNSIDACQSGCVLFRGEYVAALRCPKCNLPRYKDERRKKFLVKVLFHFPLVPRLLRMFRSPAISKLMTWHSENRSNREGEDGFLRHPCDSRAWAHFERNVDPFFALEVRNAHFALAADGVNPFKQTRSTWPVLLLNYNLPPWLCTKKFFVQLALLIPGKQSVTSNVFDVFVAPLVDELLQPWEGIPAYDVNAAAGSRTFTLRGVLLWTVHDYLGYGTVAGVAHQGYTACAWCGSDLGAEHSVELNKQTYGGIRRWLREAHLFCRPEMEHLFDGKRECRRKPKIVSNEEQPQYAAEYKEWRAAGNRDGGPGDPSNVHGVKRRTIFHELPYWQVVSPPFKKVLDSVGVRAPLRLSMWT